MAASKSGNASRAGLPSKSSVIAEGVLTPPRGAPAGARGPTLTKTYRILRTNEVDPTDAAVNDADIAAPGAPAPPAGDDFAGTARRAAKLVIGSGQTESFSDCRELLDTLPSKASMLHHKPMIGTDQNSGRVVEEERNVRVRAFLYAASHETDNDYHLIIGRDTSSVPHRYMTIEISGLPPHGNSSFAPLKGARDAYKAFFVNNLPGPTYDFYDPPIPIEVEGSLFFDMTHASGQGPGPATLRKDIPTIWEIHPVSKITFEP